MNAIHSIAELGKLVRSARKQLGLTQSQLALACGVGPRFIVELEAGKPTLRIESVLRVITGLGGKVTVSGLPNQAPEAGAGGHGA